MPVFEVQPADPTLGPLRMHYQDDGEGVPIVLVHGFTGNHRFYRRVSTNLIRHGYRVLAIDLRGHGMSDKPGNRTAYRIDAFATDIVELLDSLKIQQCLLLGHSMGAYVAQEFALRWQHRLLGLVLVDSGYGRRFASEEEAAETLAKFERVATTSGLDGLFEVTWGHLPFRNQAHRDSALRLFKQTTIGAFLGCQQGMAAWGSHLTELPAISVPALLIAGGDGPNLPSMIEIEQAIPHSELVVISGAGHNVFLDRPREFDEVLLRFLGRITFPKVDFSSILEAGSDAI